MKRYIPVALLGGIMLASLGFDSATAQSCAGNRNMCEALTHLQQARYSLDRADGNKGGYRVSAIRSVDRAIAQVRSGIRYSQSR